MISTISQFILLAVFLASSCFHNCFRPWHSCAYICVSACVCNNACSHVYMFLLVWWFYREWSAFVYVCPRMYVYVRMPMFGCVHLQLFGIWEVVLCCALVVEFRLITTTNINIGFMKHHPPTKPATKQATKQASRVYIPIVGHLHRLLLVTLVAIKNSQPTNQPVRCWLYYISLVLLLMTSFNYFQWLYCGLSLWLLTNKTNKLLISCCRTSDNREKAHLLVGWPTHYSNHCQSL